jgi:hypothetical protein
VNDCTRLYIHPEFSSHTMERKLNGTMVYTFVQGTLASISRTFFKKIKQKRRKRTRILMQCVLFLRLFLSTHTFGLLLFLPSLIQDFLARYIFTQLLE